MRPQREQQALNEVGRTRIGRAAAVGLVGLFLATVAGVPLLEPLLSDTSGVLEAAGGALGRARDAARENGLIAANRKLLDGLAEFEETLESTSFLRRFLQPPTQRFLTARLGAGNEQVYLGRDGWLFFRDDFDHVTGPGFLEPRVLERARLASPRIADPRPAILALRADLAARGIELVVMPTPVKPTVHPELLTVRADPDKLVRNPSWRRFVSELESEGVRFFDPAVVLAAAKARSNDSNGANAEPLYLRTDTHWTPAAVERTAAQLAALLDDLIDWRSGARETLTRRPVTVTGSGDTARMLAPEGTEPGTGSEAGVPWAPESVVVSRVLTRRGTPWRPQRDAEILLLGDSFTNIYSDGSLGWGNGAGLAEQLSYELGRPVDRIALNAGGSWSSRQALARAAASSERLEGKRVVVYQFATRELSRGDWKTIQLPSRR